jgi:hypothetical protein
MGRDGSAEFYRVSAASHADQSVTEVTKTPAHDPPGGVLSPQSSANTGEGVISKINYG